MLRVRVKLQRDSGEAKNGEFPQWSLGNPWDRREWPRMRNIPVAMRFCIGETHRLILWMDFPKVIFFRAKVWFLCPLFIAWQQRSECVVGHKANSSFVRYVVLLGKSTAKKNSLLSFLFIIMLFIFHREANQWAHNYILHEYTSWSRNIKATSLYLPHSQCSLHDAAEGGVYHNYPSTTSRRGS